MTQANSRRSPTPRPGFNPRPGHVGFVVDKVTLGQVPPPPKYLNFLLLLSFYQCSVLIPSSPPLYNLSNWQRHSITHTHIQQSQQTDILASDGIRTRNPSKRAATDPRLRLRGHRDLQVPPHPQKFFSPLYFLTHSHRVHKKISAISDFRCRYEIAQAKVNVKLSLYTS